MGALDRREDRVFGGSDGFQPIRGRARRVDTGSRDGANVPSASLSLPSARGQGEGGQGTGGARHGAFVEFGVEFGAGEARRDPRAGAEADRLMG